MTIPNADLLTLEDAQSRLHVIATEIFHHGRAGMSTEQSDYWSNQLHQLAVVIPYLSCFDHHVAYFQTSDGICYSSNVRPEHLGIKANRLSYGAYVNANRNSKNCVPFMERPTPEMFITASRQLKEKLDSAIQQVLEEEGFV